MANKNWDYGTEPSNGLPRKLVLVGHHFLEVDLDKPSFVPKITVFVRERSYLNGVLATEKLVDYDIIKGVISTDINGNILPKKDLEGNILYEEDGVTPLPRDNAYENIIHYVDNKIMSIYELIDAGVQERWLQDE